jgi:hypothetical protein
LGDYLSIGEKMTNEQLLAAIKLVAVNWAFFYLKDLDSEVVCCLHCNDIFSLGADAEDVPWEDTEALWIMYKEAGWPALIDWVSARRGILPLLIVQEKMAEYRRQHATRDRSNKRHH